MKVFEVVITKSHTATYVVEAEDHDNALAEAKLRLQEQCTFTAPTVKPYYSTKITVLGEEDGISVHKVTT